MMGYNLVDVKLLTDEELVKIINNCPSEYYHQDNYGVNIQYFFTEHYKYHHTVYLCKSIDEKEEWFGQPEDIIGKIVHINEIYDEGCLRGLYVTI